MHGQPITLRKFVLRKGIVSFCTCSSSVQTTVERAQKIREGFAGGKRNAGKKRVKVSTEE